MNYLETEKWSDETRGRVPRPEHREGRVALSIDQQTAKLPSDTFLWAATGSIITSLILEMTGHREKANFVAHWAPTMLMFGLTATRSEFQRKEGLNFAAGSKEAAIRHALRSPLRPGASRYGKRWPPAISLKKGAACWVVSRVRVPASFCALGAMCSFTVSFSFRLTTEPRFTLLRKQ